MIPESKPIGILLREFQGTRQHMAIIINEYGGVEGIVTMEDILEELVGEIQDEYDNENAILKREADNSYIVQGSASLTDLNEYLPESIHVDGDFETLAGFLISKLGRIPVTGDNVKTQDYEFTILKMHRSSITLVRIMTLPTIL